MTRTLRLPAALPLPLSSPPSPPGAAATTPPAARTAHEQSVKFAECIRTNGVSTFPDPTATAPPSPAVRWPPG
jgi:hypothetical protein